MQNRAPVDPWAMQRTLMEASDQHLPATPELNKGVILYQALNLEEGAETLSGLVKALLRLRENAEALGLGEHRGDLHDMALRLDRARLHMADASLAVRRCLAEIPDDFRAELTKDEIIEMADGTTDLMVTNAGFALSLGLDGAACYNEVAGSNLSKRNPDDGKIHKTPDGKWIKDPRTYRAPNLASVVFPQEHGDQAGDVNKS